MLPRHPPSSCSRQIPVLGYAELATLVTAAPVPPTVLVDPVLACALELIVSGDRDLLSLKTFRSITIVTPTEAVRIVTAA